MTNRELLSFWWGRKLPPNLEHLSDLSDLTREDYGSLRKAKKEWEEAQLNGHWLNWGQQIVADRIFEGDWYE